MCVEDEQTASQPVARKEPEPRQISSLRRLHVGGSFPAPQRGLGEGRVSGVRQTQSKARAGAFHGVWGCTARLGS